MTETLRSFPGSKWWKFDFHTHTPASGDYGHGDQTCKDITPSAWLQKAMEAGLDCVAVTDHNSAGWIDRLQTENQKLSKNSPPWYRQLTIFPGVEITVAGATQRVHLLAIFDPGCKGETVTGVLGACGITSGYGDEQTTGTQGKDFKAVVDAIEQAGGIAIPAHINGPKGLLADIKTMNPEVKKSLAAVSAAEFLNLHELDKAAYKPELRQAVQRLAKLQGSDSHEPDTLGQRYSWLKMTRPSIEGLRLALLDHEFCVKNQHEDPNHLPDVYLEALSVQDMVHCGRVSGRPLEMPLHPHLNTIIGGRGAGKSTLLESIRIALRQDQGLADEVPDTNRSLGRFMQIPASRERDQGVMTEKTEILLTLCRRQKRYRLRWQHEGRGAALEEETNGQWQATESGDIKERFPASVYSQRQINELSSNPRGLLQIVDRAPGVNRAEWQSRWESAKSEFLQLRGRRRELLRQLDDEPQTHAELQDVKSDLKEYEKKGHGEVLQQYQKLSQQKNALPDDRAFDDFAQHIRQAASKMALPDFPDHLFAREDPAAAEIKQVHEKASLAIEAIGKTLQQLAMDVEKIKADRANAIASSNWHQAVKASTQAYEKLVKEYSEKQGQFSMSVYGQWVEKRNRLQLRLKALESVREEADATARQIDGLLAKMQELRLELFQKRQGFLKQVIGSNPFVRMELVPYGDVSTLESDYRAHLHLEDDFFATAVCDSASRQGILWPCFNWEQDGTPASDLPRFIAAIKEGTMRIAGGKRSESHKAFDNRLQKLFLQQPTAFDHLEAWWPEDLLRVRYARDAAAKQFDSLERGSAGQKAAAILAFLLSYGDEPLIIDQPEDDLDNSLTYALIVKQIHENKNRRQIVIVTHNPNIVVNGDSELVHVLKFAGGQIQIDQQGGLEESGIREKICTIMEGGKEAFAMRYKRINLEV